MAGHLHQPRAVQITRLTDKGKIVIDPDAIEQLFGNAEVKNAQICIYSIAGALRSGKSLFMSLMLRYLEHKSGNKKGNWRDDNESVLNTGFKWRGGADGHTRGIEVWSEPFWLKAKTGKQVAAFVMDTQGLFDELSTKQGDSLLFTLSTFLSSYQIFNLKNNINTNDLEKLQMFSDFYQQVVSQKEWKTCQSLLFLVRDWQDKSFPVGHVGGNEYLKRKQENSSAEYHAIYVEIQKTFENTECALMPYPGLDVAERAADDPPAKLDEIRCKFTEACDDIFGTLFKNPVVKTMNENPLTGTDLVNLAYTISNLIESNGFGVGTMVKASVSANLQKIISCCEKKFCNSVKVKEMCQTTEELKNTHKVSVEKAMEKFDKKRKIGNPVKIKNTRKEFLESLMNRFFMFQYFNEHLEVDVQEKQCELFEKCVHHYMKSFTADLTITDEEQLKLTVFEKKQEAIAMFDPPPPQQRRLEVEIWIKYKKQAEDVIDAKTKVFELKNSINELGLDMHLRKTIIKTVDSFVAVAKEKGGDTGDIPELIRSAAETARKKFQVGDFTVELTSPIIEVNRERLETFMEEVQNIYKERLSIERAIALGDVRPLTFSYLQKIVASHGEINSDSMPPNLQKQVLEKIPKAKRGSVLTTVAEMCKNEWNLQHFMWKRKKENERIKALEAQVSSITNMITQTALPKLRSSTEIKELFENEAHVFQNTVRSIPDKTFIEDREKSMRKMLGIIQEVWEAENRFYENRIDAKLDNLLKWTTWKCCQEMNRQLHGLCAKQDFMDEIKKKMKNEFDENCQKITQNHASREKFSNRFEYAIGAQMSHWERINEFHKQVYPRMTGWGEFVRSFKHFVNHKFFDSVPEFAQKPITALSLLFLSKNMDWRKRLALLFSGKKPDNMLEQ